MNFTEAAQALKDGLCEGFRRETWQRGIFLEIGSSASKPLIFNYGAAYISYLCDFIANDYVLVNPKPQMETVTTTVKVGLFPNGSYDVAPRIWRDDYPLIEGTLTFKKPAEKKVKRRLEIPSTAIALSCTNLISSIDYKFFAEWEEGAP